MVKEIDFNDLDDVKKDKLIDLIKLIYFSDYLSKIKESYKTGVKKITISELFPKLSKFIISNDKFSLYFLHNPHNSSNYHIQIKLEKKVEKRLKESLEKIDLKKILEKLSI